MIPSQGNMNKDGVKYSISSFWHIFHSGCAYYPDEPTDQDKENHKEFLETFTETAKQSVDFEEFGTRFGKLMEEHPPILDSRKAYSIWMCEHHNRIREEDGKELFDCSYDNLGKRWGPPK
ncbi:unnamed protein product [Moneuplotes crassus]|uniref:Sulfhydryl oxidase n=1 Tax=Euplotes crassus TaxID=5936 RepID=A0AAD1XYW2_EUPCR|nr:unnamed protein product [Moneuplotes crassus]